MLKKIFFFIVVVALIGGGYYYWTIWQKQDDVAVPPLQQGLVKLADPSVVSPAASISNSALVYGLSTGHMMKYYIDTQTITEYPLPEIFTKSFHKIYWPENGNDFIVSTKLDGQTAFYYYNSKTSLYNKLPANIVSLDWVNNSRQIVYVWRNDDGTGQLVISDSDGTGYSVVKPLPWSDVVLKASPANNTVLMYKEASSQPISKIYIYDLLTAGYTEAVSTGNNTGAVWAPDGTAFAYTVLENGNSKVMYHNLATGQSYDVGLVSTADKLAFSQDSEFLYVASQDANGQEPVWKYDTGSKVKNVLFVPENIRPRNIVVIGQKLFFLSQDNTLYSYQ